MKIVSLTRNHEEALREFTVDFNRAGESSIPGFFRDSDETHDDCVMRFAAESRGEGLKPNRVASTTLFLESNDQLLGVVNIRHTLNEPLRLQGGHVGYSVRPSRRREGHGLRLLKAGMDEARDIGLSSILVTCDPANLASAGIIEKCGGQMEDEFFHEPISRQVRRYWIDLLQA